MAESQALKVCMQELQALLHRNGLPSWYVGQCAHVCRHCAMLFSNASCNYYQAGDCQARRAKDVTITTVCRRVPALTPRFLYRSSDCVQTTQAIEIWILLLLVSF